MAKKEGKPFSVLDESEKDPVVPQITYDVSSYGSDLDVEGLVRRLRASEILVPPFQRDYVWNQPEASRFIESLLLGLPVPGVFFATDPATNKLLVIDGQQRLKSLQFFFDGYFNPRPDEKRRKVFSLVKVQKRFLGKTHGQLDEKDRIRLGNAVIHATIVSQSNPPGDDTSVFHIFERLNSGGRRLTAQEIRVALYHGGLTDQVRKLNQLEPWRKLVGKPHPRLKDQELILRFLALYEGAEKYSRPMSEFLSKYSGSHLNPPQKDLNELGDVFERAIVLFVEALGRTAFRPTRAINAAVFDSTMVGMARRLAAKQKPPTPLAVKKAYALLMSDRTYTEAVSRSTADEAFVARRLKLATASFASI